MTSLSEVYEPDAEFQTSLRRLYAGLGLFAAGSVLMLVSIVVGTTSLVEPTWAAREWAGILAGLGVPAVFVGVFAVLPADRRTRAAAGVGAAVAVLGVALFTHAYPCQWTGTNCANGQPILTLPVTVIYFAGTITTFFTLFVGVANFKSRNSPGGTAQVEVTAQGETKVIEVPESELSKFSGSLGVLGDGPDAESPDHPGTAGSVASDGGADGGTVTEVTDEAIVERKQPQDGGASSDSGGDAAQSTPTRERGIQSTGGGVGSKPTSPHRTGDWEPSGDAGDGESDGADRDRYCGSCEHFRYVQTENGMQPYCGAHSELMDDMEACPQYSPRSEN